MFTMENVFQDYYIYREPTSPAGTVGSLNFFPPKDSDDLFDILRLKFPHIKSHSERMAEATIQFLMEEQQVDLLSASCSTGSPVVTDTASVSPWQQSWPSMSATSSSSFSSPELRNVEPSLALPSQSPAAATSTTTSTPQLNQMTGVFSITSSQPRQHVRRKMTEAEKVEYRKRRIVKACDKCAKRKRKCNHNQQALESAPTRQTKITKQHAMASTRLSSTVAAEPVAQPDLAFFDDPFTSDMQLFDDFTNILDDPLFTDDALNYGAQPVHVEPQRVPIAPDFVLPNDAHHSHESTNTMRRLQQDQCPISRTGGHGNRHEAPLHDQVMRAVAEPGREQSVPTHTSHTHESVGAQAYQHDGKAQRGHINGSGTDIAWPQAKLQVKVIPDTNSQKRHDSPVNATCQQDESFAGTDVRTTSIRDSPVNATGPQNQTFAGTEVDRSSRVSRRSALSQRRPIRDERREFGAAIARAPNPSTDLYMLRRRGIPGHLAQNQLALAMQGGMRATSSLSNVARIAGGLGNAIAQDVRSGDSPVHTRSRNPLQSDSAAGHGGQLNITSTLQAQELGEHRLRDTNRHKDHHGRDAVLQVIASVLMAAATLTFCRESTSAILMALSTPIVSTRKAKSEDIISPLASMMQTLQV